MECITNSSRVEAACGSNDPIPVYRSQLPSFDAIVPYLRHLDETRQYSNFGELALSLGERLAAKFNVAPEHVTLASSGTAALVGAILAVAGRATAERPFCILPSYTFSATATAAELCGYTVHLVDVNRDSWALDPQSMISRLPAERIGLILPVCPYGTWIDQAAWIEFSGATGIPVVIDAAASFENLLKNPVGVGSIPVALSFHASKSYSTAEGGRLSARMPARSRP